MMSEDKLGIPDNMEQDVETEPPRSIQLRTSSQRCMPPQPTQPLPISTMLFTSVSFKSRVPGPVQHHQLSYYSPLSSSIPPPPFACEPGMPPFLKLNHNYHTMHRPHFSNNRLQTWSLLVAKLSLFAPSEELLRQFPGVVFHSSVVNLGVFINEELKMDLHVGSMVRSCFYQLRQIRTIRQSLSDNVKRTHVINDTVFSASNIRPSLSRAPKFGTLFCSGSDNRVTIYCFSNRN